MKENQEIIGHARLAYCYLMVFLTPRLSKWEIRYYEDKLKFQSIFSAMLSIQTPRTKPTMPPTINSSKPLPHTSTPFPAPAVETAATVDVLSAVIVTEVPRDDVGVIIRDSNPGVSISLVVSKTLAELSSADVAVVDVVKSGS